MKQTQAYRIEFQHFKEDGSELWIKMIANEDPSVSTIHLNQLRVDNPSKTYRLVLVEIKETVLES
jgi:hypothetical protein